MGGEGWRGGEEGGRDGEEEVSACMYIYMNIVGYGSEAICSDC